MFSFPAAWGSGRACLVPSKQVVNVLKHKVMDTLVKAPAGTGSHPKHRRLAGACPHPPWSLLLLVCWACRLRGQPALTGLHGHSLGVLALLC